MSNTFTINPTHDLLLRGNSEMPIGLYHLRLATTAQLCALHYSPGMHKTVLKRLKVLTDNGYVQANAIAMKNKDVTGHVYLTSRYYYTLGKKGLQFLDDLGLDVHPLSRASKTADTNYITIGHDLELNDIFIAALRLKYANAGYYLARRISARSFQRDPLWVTYRGITQRLEPDGFLEIRNRSTNNVVPLLFVHDHGTEQQAAVKRTIRKYRALLYEKSYQMRLQISTVTVCFTTFMNMQRMTQIRRWAREELRDAPQLSGRLLFAELPIPVAPCDLLFDRRWYTVYDSQPVALSGD